MRAPSALVLSSGAPIMRKPIAIALAALVGASFFLPIEPVRAGEADGAGAVGSVSGCDCSNACPLAQEVNTHRSTGAEAILASKFVRDDLVRVVMKNLATL